MHMKSPEEEEKKVEPINTTKPVARQNNGIMVTVTQESVSNAYAWGDNRHG